MFLPTSVRLHSSVYYNIHLCISYHLQKAGQVNPLQRDNHQFKGESISISISRLECTTSTGAGDSTKVQCSTRNDNAHTYIQHLLRQPQPKRKLIEYKRSHLLDSEIGESFRKLHNLTHTQGLLLHSTYLASASTVYSIYQEGWIGGRGGSSNFLSSMRVETVENLHSGLILLCSSSSTEKRVHTFHCEAGAYI